MQKPAIATKTGKSVGAATVCEQMKSCIQGADSARSYMKTTIHHRS